jgi:hypothetical protein
MVPLELVEAMAGQQRLNSKNASQSPSFEHHGLVFTLEIALKRNKGPFSERTCFSSEAFQAHKGQI